MANFPNQINGVNDELTDQPESKFVEGISFEDIDLSVLLDFEAIQCEGESDLIVELIDLYLADVPQQLSAIKDSILKADIVSVNRIAHNLKGGSANLGVKSIARLCEDLEQIENIESSPKINFVLNHLEQAFERVRQSFLIERQNRVGSAN